MQTTQYEAQWQAIVSKNEYRDPPSVTEFWTPVILVAALIVGFFYVNRRRSAI
jgi:hypothetical protein